MFVRTLCIEYARGSGPPQPCPLAWIDNFAMRNFTNSAIFDDTLPIGDGRMEVGLRVPLAALAQAMTEWFRRKSYLSGDDRLVVHEERKPGISE